MNTPENTFDGVSTFVVLNPLLTTCTVEPALQTVTTVIEDWLFSKSTFPSQNTVARARPSNANSALTNDSTSEPLELTNESENK